MSNIPHLQLQTIFKPQALDDMSRTLNETCAALDVRDSRSRTTVAIRILDLARLGVTEPEILKERILRESRVAQI